MRVDYRRDRIVVDMSVTVLDDLDSSDGYQTSSVNAKHVDLEVSKPPVKQLTLFFSLVREHRTKSDVADALDAFCTSIELIVDNYTTPLVRLHADVLQSQFIGIWFPSNRNKDNISVELDVDSQRMPRKRSS